jgi:4-aminobutyrate aminotransferase-like enzyme
VGTEHVDALLLAPPLIFSAAEIDEIAGRLDGALAEVEDTL